MPFQKGHKKLGGRKKGSVGSEKRIAREIVEAALGGSIPGRLVQIAKSNPTREPDILIALMPYCYPKLQNTEVKADVTTTESGLAQELMKEMKLVLHLERESLNQSPINTKPMKLEDIE